MKLIKAVRINTNRSFGRQYRGYATPNQQSGHDVAHKDRNIFVGSADWFELRAWASAVPGVDLTTTPSGAILRVGENTIQLWEQEEETNGWDNHYWMVCRGPAFPGAGGSERLTAGRLREAVRYLT